jgi:transposase
MEIRLLSDHRRDLVGERTRAQNRLRWHLVALCPDLEEAIKPRRLDGVHQLERIDRRMRRLPVTARTRIAREQVRQICGLTRQINALELQLHKLVKAHRPQLLAETGCGTLTAAILIGRTAGVQRFRSDASFARLTGTAPIPAHPVNAPVTDYTAAGDRQLNHALHIIASDARRDAARWLV